MPAKMFSMEARDGGGTRLVLNYKHADWSYGVKWVTGFEKAAYRGG